MSENELVVLDKNTDLMSVFTTPKGLEPVLQKVRKELDEFKSKCEIATAAGRKEIASMAHKVSRSKTYLDTLGKGLVDELKEKPKLVDAERKRIRDVLDQWKDEIRKPLTDWENAESDRLLKLKERHSQFEVLIANARSSSTSEQVQSQWNILLSIVVDDSWQEWKEQAQKTHAEAELIIRLRFEELKKREQLEIQLAEERKKREEQEKAERERRLAEEAADRERKLAEQRERELKEQAERERREAEEKVRRLEEEKRQSELREQLAKQEAENARLRAEQRERELKEQAERDKQAAIEAEKNRQEIIRRQAEEARIVEEERKAALKKAQEEDEKHKNNVQEEILYLMCELGYGNDISIQIVNDAMAGKLGRLKVDLS